MKSAMHHALKNHMAKAKMSAPDAMKGGDTLKDSDLLKEGSAAEEASESPKKERDEDLGDAAPSVKDAAAGHAAHLAGMPGAAGELGPEHIPLLQQLIEQLSNHGRPAVSLDERAGDKMKEKMASIQSHKKSV